MLTKEQLTLSEMLDFDQAYEKKRLFEETEMLIMMECHENDILREIWRKRRIKEEKQYRDDILKKNSDFFANFDERSKFSALQWLIEMSEFTGDLSRSGMWLVHFNDGTKQIFSGAIENVIRVALDQPEETKAYRIDAVKKDIITL